MNRDVSVLPIIFKSIVVKTLSYGDDSLSLILRMFNSRINSQNTIMHPPSGCDIQTTLIRSSNVLNCGKRNLLCCLNLGDLQNSARVR